ncbi:unnamed protein product [Auanema sp. JU1783]|nr:unnamed protein product [Auanema sp. JU1783]
MSAEAISRKSSFVNSRLLSKSRQHSENKLNGSDDFSEGRSNDSSTKEINMLDDGASCSEMYPDDGGTRRARSLASSRISLFFGKEKNDLINRLTTMKENTNISLPFLELEEHWKIIVQNNQDLSRRCMEQQEAIWELVTTECRYIQVLKNMADLKEYLKELQRNGFLKDIAVEKVFLNYDELFDKHKRFWEKNILPMLEQSRTKGCPLSITYLKPMFSTIISWAHYYTAFTSSHNDSLLYLQKKQKDTHLFAEFVSWAESQDSMRRQKLSDTLTMPMQRLTRYSLLLKAVLRSSTETQEKELVQSLIDQVEEATHMLNLEMNNNDLRHQLEEIRSQIDSYDCVDQDEFEKIFYGQRCCLDLVHPMPYFPPNVQVYRRLFHRGELKIREGKQGPKMEMYCLVFTDMFLICRKKADRLRIARPPMHLTSLICHPFPDGTGFYLLHMNVFHTCSQLYMMHTGGVEETRKWTELLGMARDEFRHLHRAYTLPHDSPIDDSTRGPFSGVAQNLANMSIVHRKSSSMDSQTVAIAHAHAHMNHMHRMGTVSSTEQLNRYNDRLDSPQRLPPLHKLSVASCVANPLSTSRSSVDLHMALGAEAQTVTFTEDRPRSRSNSSGPDIEGAKSVSRSPSPSRRTDSREVNTPVNGIEENHSSPTLLVTSDEDPPPQGRRFEKRYHTADAIDMKPKGAAVVQGGILKRFSWNHVSSAMGASSRRITAKLGEIQHNRRHSQASQTSIHSVAASSESFGSSTSGISSSSDGCPLDMNRTHISTIAVNESPSESTINISLDLTEESDQPVCLETRSPPAPPLPDVPPPPPPPMPIISQATPTSSCKQQELLKFILENQLETSSVN